MNDNIGNKIKYFIEQMGKTTARTLNFKEGDISVKVSIGDQHHDITQDN